MTRVGEQLSQPDTRSRLSAAGFPGGAQDPGPFGFRIREPAVFTLRTAGENERDRGVRHQPGDIEGAHQVQADFGQADAGGQAVEFAQAAVRVLFGQ